MKPMMKRMNYHKTNILGIKVKQLVLTHTKTICQKQICKILLIELTIRF